MEEYDEDHDHEHDDEDEDDDEEHDALVQQFGLPRVRRHATLDSTHWAHCLRLMFAQGHRKASRASALSVWVVTRVEVSHSLGSLGSAAARLLAPLSTHGRQLACLQYIDHYLLVLIYVQAQTARVPLQGMTLDQMRQMYADGDLDLDDEDDDEEDDEDDEDGVPPMYHPGAAVMDEFDDEDDDEDDEETSDYDSEPEAGGLTKSEVRAQPGKSCSAAPAKHEAGLPMRLFVAGNRGERRSMPMPEREHPATLSLEHNLASPYSMSQTTCDRCHHFAQLPTDDAVLPRSRLQAAMFFSVPRMHSPCADVQMSRLRWGQCAMYQVAGLSWCGNLPHTPGMPCA